MKFMLQIVRYRILYYCDGRTVGPNDERELNYESPATRALLRCLTYGVNRRYTRRNAERR